jgi:hypothetical protein
MDFGTVSTVWYSLFFIRTAINVEDNPNIEPTGE